MKRALKHTGVESAELLLTMLAEQAELGHERGRFEALSEASSLLLVLIDESHGNKRVTDALIHARHLVQRLTTEPLEAVRKRAVTRSSKGGAA
jgi:hypothetical protein